MDRKPGHLRNSLNAESQAADMLPQVANESLLTQSPDSQTVSILRKLQNMRTHKGLQSPSHSNRHPSSLVAIRSLST